MNRLTTSTTKDLLGLVVIVKKRSFTTRLLYLLDLKKVFLILSLTWILIHMIIKRSFISRLLYPWSRRISLLLPSLILLVRTM